MPVETYMDRRFRELLSRKEALYSAIKELDFDFKTDKISREDYQELGESYRGEALSLLKDIDGMEKGEGLGSLIEKEIISRRKSSSLPGRIEEEDKMGDMEATLEREILALRKSLPSCPQCGSGYDKKDRFCSKCGRKLT